MGLWPDCVDFRVVNQALNGHGFFVEPSDNPEDDDERYFLYSNGPLRATVRRPNEFGMVPVIYADQAFYSFGADPPDWPLEDCGGNG
jgi:hypothetical protein